MASPLESSSPSMADLLEKLAAVEKRLAGLEAKGNPQPLTEAGLASKDQADTKAPDGAKNEVAQESSDTRVKIVITFRDPETNEPVVKDSKPQTAGDEDKDKDKYAFVLNKIVYEKDSFHKPKSEIDIKNMELWSLLKKHLGHYPYHTFRDLPVVLFSPFEPIVLYFDRLIEVAADAKTAEDAKEKKAGEDLELLLNTISGGKSGDEQLDKYFKMRPGYKKQSPETVQFEDLWTVFTPGMLVYGRPFQDQDQVFVVKDNNMTWPQKTSPWELEAWSYDWNNDSFSRTQYKLKFEDFDGHRPLTSLRFYPFHLHSDYEAIRAKLIKRGNRFREICQANKNSRLFVYRGKAMIEKKGFLGASQDEKASELDLISALSLFGDLRLHSRRRALISADSSLKPSEVSGRVMVDYESFFQYVSSGARNGTIEPGQSGPECTCSDCVKNTGFRQRYRTHFDERKYAKNKEWEDEQYLLCPPRVLGYILKEKQWAQLQVTYLRDPPPEDKESGAWEKRLAFADDRTSKDDEMTTKEILMDLVRSHASASVMDRENRSQLEVNDIIPGKGKGLVILLYGPPGVGKTLTAETISTATRKPLFSVSVADVGTDPKKVEGNLDKIFALATKWQAILLIDEADVFLESRGRGNAIRSTDQNALVSVFLRVLEYYHGIMFLTTNQIAEFDVAIPSRIHMAISYSSLNKKQMESIFYNFLDKLDEKGLIQDYDNIKEWLKESVYEVKLDGRQIRNIVTTALSLARAGSKYRHEPEKLAKAHLRQAFINVKNFKVEFRDQLQIYKESQKEMIKMSN